MTNPNDLPVTAEEDEHWYELEIRQKMREESKRRKERENHDCEGVSDDGGRED